MPTMYVKGVELRMQVLSVAESGVMIQCITAKSTGTRYKFPNKIVTLGLADTCGLTGFREIQRTAKTKKDELILTLTFSVGTHTGPERRAAFLGAVSSSLKFLRK